MAGLNKVMVIGNLGGDPELRYSPQGTAFTNFSVATSDSWADRNTGEKQERTEWHRIVTFGKTAENCAKYLSKGRQVYVEGKLQTSSYEKDGQTHYTTKIIADVVHFLGTKQDGGAYNQQQGAGGYQSQQGGSQQGGGQQQGGYQPPKQQQQQGGYQQQGGGYPPANSGNPQQMNQNSQQPMPSDPTAGNNVPPEDDIPF
ncbi:MAG: single-stranded DNA-binding protein [Desulfamplus sp.]